MDLQFLGAAGTVTGSRYLLTTGNRRVLVDCGLFQGVKALRERNWEPFPVAPSSIDAVVLTHAHLDHTGYLPRLVRDGFRGPVFCTRGTRDVAALLLPDSGHLQEEDARYANRRGFSKHRPALPLYTQEDAEATLKQFVPVEYDVEQVVTPGVRVRFQRAGHLLGAASLLIEADGARAFFSGDVGRPDDSILLPPVALPDADYIVVESTYGDRLHSTVDPKEQLAKAIQRTVSRGGVVVVPAFAVGRAQALCLLVHELKVDGRIPDVPVYLNSPMALNASALYCSHHHDHRLTTDLCRAVCSVAKPVRTVEESKALNNRREPMILIASSGMATGGRILHHLKAFAPDPRNTIVLTGFQSPGTRGAALAAGSPTVKIHGEAVAVNAEIVRMEGVSGHADQRQLLEWLASARRAPQRVFVTHGEPRAAQTLATEITRSLGWSCSVPKSGELYTLVASLQQELPAASTAANGVMQEDAESCCGG